MEIAVIGGGAAGLFAASIAARGSAHVSLYEGGSLPGKKILATGNGRCNFTNMSMDPACYRSRCPERMRPALEAFGPDDVRSFFLELGVPSMDRDGYVYPLSGQASSVREALMAEVLRRGVSVHNNSHIVGIQRNDTGTDTTYTLVTDSGYAFCADTVILACGGNAMPSTGSDGSGVQLAKLLGLCIVPTVPALTSLDLDGYPAALHGVRCTGRIRILVEGSPVDESFGELQFTRTGISGIPAFQVSRWASDALREKKAVKAELDLSAPGEPDTAELLRSMGEANVTLTLSQALKGIYPAKLAEVLAQLLMESIPAMRDGQILSQQMEEVFPAIRQVLSHLRFPVTGTGDHEQSQVTAGGVSLAELDPATMEAITCPGLYLVGEMVDVDGICGGYNLQWAWSSAYAAGCAASERSRKITKNPRIPYTGSVLKTHTVPRKKEEPGHPGRRKRR